ncbi:cellulase family glycosylhydrolase [Sinimarinibacterium sp. CAU 1509]|uniref:cellulase family glycosylhydrolase n=1 Tax=Sinimarinibacterium sp. CAU 1509 TaxID=2562283 RepID=UPI00146A82A8|nr:cellulase family glycosylhydrolase [Sinimarinibacterium sp. CAU 1509]
MHRRAARGWLVAAGLTAGLLSACGGDSASTAKGVEPVRAKLTQSGRWLMDADGRVVVLHGFNMVAKRPPYRPSALGFGADDADFIASQGFNTVRLGLIHKGFVPEPGHYDAAYLDDIAATAELLTARGIYVLLDFHQDLYNERYQGEGFADWATQDSVAGDPADSPRCAQGFPVNIFTCDALWEAFDRFLGINGETPAQSARGMSLQDEFAEAWTQVAQRFVKMPGVFGYDLLNEPYPGSATLTCLNPLGCLGDQDTALTAFHQRVVDAITIVDPQTVLFYEPYATNFNAGFPTAHGELHGANGFGLSFHNYACPFGVVGIPPELGLGTLCGPLFEQSVFGNAEAQAQKYPQTLLLSEFGATDDIDAITRMVDLADANRVSWQYWAWWNEDVCCERPDEGVIDHPSNPPTAEHLDQAKLDALVRPFPRRIAGTPEAWSFSAGTRQFELSYLIKAADGSTRDMHGALTEVWVPRRHYPNGYEASVDGADIVSAADAEVLQLRARTDASSVQLVLTAR